MWTNIIYWKVSAQSDQTLPDNDSAPEDHHEPNANDTSGRVVERQGVVENRVLDGAEIAQVEHARAVKVESRVFYHSRFGETWKRSAVRIWTWTFK